MLDKKISFATWILGSLVFLSCDEAPLLKNNGALSFNAPIDAIEVPNADLALVLNANINLDEADGSILPVKLSTQTALPDEGIRVPSLAGTLLLDPTTSHMFVSSRARDSVLVYDYAVTGLQGQSISFTPKNVEDPAVDAAHAIKTDDEPFGMVKATGTQYGDVLLVVNSLSGSLTVIDLSTLKPIDLNPDDSDLNGLRLFSSSSISRQNSRPAKSASRVILHPSAPLAFVSLSNLPYIYVIDLTDFQVEAMMDFSNTLGGSGGFRDMIFDATGKLLVLYPRLGQLLKVDVSNVTDNGIHQEDVIPQIESVVQVGNLPEGLTLSDSGLDAFISLLRENKVSVLNLASEKITNTIELQGVGPGKMLKLTGQNKAWINEFSSNSIAILDLSTKSVVGSIQ